MKMIGFTGGSTLCELGSPADVQLFFDCLDAYAVKKNPEQDWTLLTERLYKRYLRLEELNSATDLMNKVRMEFSGMTKEAINWEEMANSLIETRLDSNKETLADIFDKYFECFGCCVESARINYEAFRSYPGYKYEAVRLVVSDQPWFLIEKKRPLDDYDALDDIPFWMR